MERHAGDAPIRLRGPRPRARMSVTASRTAAALVRLSLTLPTSDSRTISGERILATTPNPCASQGRAVAAASSALRARERGSKRNGIGREQARHLDRIEPGAARARAPSLPCPPAPSPRPA